MSPDATTLDMERITAALRRNADEPPTGLPVGRAFGCAFWFEPNQYRRDKTIEILLVRVEDAATVIRLFGHMFLSHECMTMLLRDVVQANSDHALRQFMVGAAEAAMKP